MKALVGANLVRLTVWSLAIWWVARLYGQVEFAQKLALIVGRVWALCNSWLSYLERGVFPGGCFFWAVAEEFDSRPGPVRDSVLEKKAYWSYSIERSVREAQEAGEVDRDVDPEQLAWELDSLLGGVNSGFKGGDGQRAIERGRRAIRDRLNRAATPAAKPLS